MENPIMTLTMADGGKIVCELYPDKAPQSVRNMISLANKGFYDGLIFHRVISGFMIQGGCPKGTGTGGPGYCIKGEFKLNGVKNNLSHKRGVLSMARAQAANSAGSQFFIMHEDGEFLDGQYAAFGKVLEGMDVVDKIAAVKTDGNDRPLTEQKIASIRVDTRGEEYPDADQTTADPTDGGRDRHAVRLTVRRPPGPSAAGGSTPVQLVAGTLPGTGSREVTSASNRPPRPWAEDSERRTWRPKRRSRVPERKV